MPEHPTGAALAVTRSPDYAHGETMTERGTGAPPSDAPAAPFPAPAAGIPIPLPPLTAEPEGEAAPGSYREVVVALHAIASHLVRIDGRLDAIESHLVRVDGRLDAIESRLDALERRVDALELQVDALKERMNRVEHIIERLADRSDRQANNLDALRKEMYDGFMKLQQSQQRWFWVVIVPLSIAGAANLFR